MRSSEYHIVSHWRVQASLEEVAAILGDPMALPHWWPEVYLGVEEIESGNQQGVGQILAVHSRGWLPYTLRWSFRVIESRWPQGVTIEATGDLNGSGRWLLEQDGSWVRLTYDWRVRADKPLLRGLSFLLWPVFAANHRWAMARGEAGLARELARRREESPSAV